MTWNGAWPSQPLSAALQAFDSLRQVVNLQATSADDVSAHLARFLVIRSCGIIEKASELSMEAYLVSKSAPRVARFGRSWFGGGANPSPGKLVAMVQRFDPGWGDELSEFLNRDDELLKRELAVLVDARNKIAHGESESIRTRRALDLAAHAELIAIWFVHRFDPR